MKKYQDRIQFPCKRCAGHSWAKSQAKCGHYMLGNNKGRIQGSFEIGLLKAHFEKVRIQNPPPQLNPTACV